MWTFLTLFKRIVKIFLRRKDQKDQKTISGQNMTKKYNYLIINESNKLDHPVDKDQKWSFQEKSNNSEKNRTILEGETFCGSFNHFLYYS